MKDLTNGRLGEIFRHAAKYKLHENMTNVLASLSRHEYGGRNVILIPDFAPLSLGFIVTDDVGTLILNGGVIYHGPHDNGGDGSAPSFSVNVGPHHGWSIHT